MEKTINFQKKDNEWYLDNNNNIENFAFSMTLILNYISNCKYKLSITISDYDPGYNVPIKLTMKYSNDKHICYNVSGTLVDNLDDKYKEICFCNKIYNMLGEHPEHIYVTKVVGLD